MKKYFPKIKSNEQMSIMILKSDVNELCPSLHNCDPIIQWENKFIEYYNSDQQLKEFVLKFNSYASLCPV